MTSGIVDTAPDVWSEWLLHGRHGNDAEYGEFVDRRVSEYADRVLDGARLEEGMTLVDVGCGDGLVGFRAIERVGPSLKVIFTDVSEALLGYAGEVAAKRGVGSQCEFVRCGADGLAGVADGRADAVTTRAALAYVVDKEGAIRAFRRVLKAGGWMSLGEPIFRDDALATKAMRERLVAAEGSSRRELLALLHRWRAAQFPDTEEAIAGCPITNYSERDLFSIAQMAEFEEIRMELCLDVSPSGCRSWPIFLKTSPHPLAPSLERILAERFSSAERRVLEQAVRPAVEDTNSVSTGRMAYLTARRLVRLNEIDARECSVGL